MSTGTASTFQLNFVTCLLRMVLLLLLPLSFLQWGGAFTVSWRNYIRSVFQKGFMYRLSCKPSVILYVAENKTLAGKEDRKYGGEALGRKMAIVFFEDLIGSDLVRRVDRETSGMKQVLLSVAELLQTVGGVAVPADPGSPASQTEILLERLYEGLRVQRFSGITEPGAHEPHVFQLDGEVGAEQALAQETPVANHTKMLLARALQRNNEFAPDETLQSAWGESLASLKARAAPLFAPPAVPEPEPLGLEAPPGPAGRGRGRGKGGEGGAGPAPAPAGRGGGRGRAGPAAKAPARGRARGRGRG